MPTELLSLLEGKDVQVGVIDVASDAVETPEEVAATIEPGAQVRAEGAHLAVHQLRHGADAARHRRRQAARARRRRGAGAQKIWIKRMSQSKRPAYVAYAAHALHDGFTDLMYVLLPLFQAEFSLAYAQTGLLRSIYAGGMALFQVPSGQLAGRFGNRAVLAMGTALAACGYLLAGFGNGFLALIIALAVLGLGLSTQHPISADLVAETYRGAASRKAIGTNNFAGDLGKMIFPAAVALLLLFMSWRSAVLSVGCFGLLAALAIFLLLSHRRTITHCIQMLTQRRLSAIPATAIPWRGNFLTLLSIGVIDSATRMGFLTFLPFLLQQKGASVQSIGFALTLVFAGGALGKFVCGHLGARLGTIATVFLTEGLTAACILLLIPLPLLPAFVLLPVLGIMLNGPLVGALRQRAGTGRCGGAAARLRNLLYWHDRFGRGLACALRPVQRRDRRRVYDDHHRRRGAVDAAARLEIACRLAAHGGAPGRDPVTSPGFGAKNRGQAKVPLGEVRGNS